MWNFGVKSKIHTGFLMRKLEERYYLVELRVDTDLIIHWIFNTRNEGLKWIDVAQDSKNLTVVFDTVMNLWLPQSAEFSRLTED